MQNFFRQTIIILFALFLRISLFSQNEITDFSQYTIDDGLSQSVIQCLFQDTKGYIWIGTQNGLNKFDGYLFTKYNHNNVDTNSISDNWIFSIVEDKEQNLWIGTKRGLNKYIRNENSFITIDFGDDIPREIQNRVYGLDVSKSGDIIINISPYLVIYNPATDKFKSYHNDIEYDTGDKNEQIPVMEDSDGLIWIASNYGLSYFNPKNMEFHNFKADVDNPTCVSKDTIAALYEDNKGNIWIGTSYGLNKYNKTSGTFQKIFAEPGNRHGLSGNYIHAIIEDDFGNLWFGTDYNGLNKMAITDEGKMIFTQFTSRNNQLNHNKVLDLLIDKSKNLWIGTLQGISKTDLKPKKFKLYQKSDKPSSVDLLDNVVASLYKDKDGIVWVGNWGSGLNLLNRETNEVEHYSTNHTANHYLPDDYVHVIFEDHNGKVWIGTRNGALIFDEKERVFVPIQQYFSTAAIPSFKNIRINSIIQDKNDNYWFGTQNGLYKVNFSDTSYIFFTADKETEPRLSGNYIYELLEDSDGLIWIAESSGLDVYNPKNQKFTHYQKNNTTETSLCDNFVVALCEDYQGNIWIGTNTGVNRFVKNDSIFEFYYKEAELPANLVYEILEDDNKNLWFTTGNGLALFQRETKKFKTYTIAEGLQSMEFNLGGKYKSKDGEVFFGGMHGVNSFYPDSLKDNPYIPEIVITKLQKSDGINKKGIHIEGKEQVVLDYEDIEFTIAFAALEYTNPAENQYAYFMEGISNQWIKLENRRFVPFSGLPPGDYVFHVRGTNNDGIWNKEGTSLKIRIKPPWWQSQWAYLAYVILLIVAIFAFIKLREQKLIHEKEVLEKKVASRTKEINLQKQKIEKAYQNVKLLSDIGQKITAELTLEGIIETVYDSINNLLDASVFAIGVYNHEKNCLEFSGAKENGKMLPNFTVHLDNKNSPSIICFTQQKELMINSQNEINEHKDQTIIGERPEAMLFCPLIIKEKSMGIVTVQSFNPGAYKNYHLNLIRNIAVYTSIALENAHSVLQIEKQRDEITKSHQQITDSINYAKRIQSAALPSFSLFKEHFAGFFVLYRPKQIVSGDFYWVEKNDNKILLAAADCTGHGVPGAFMSMLGMSFLNDIVNREKYTKPASILNELRKRIKNSLSQTNSNVYAKDGMDISFCTIDLQTNKLQFAGAYNPLYINRKNESGDYQLIETKGDKQPVAVYYRETPFTNHTIQLQTDDRIYLFSDGYIDQNGGEKGKKFLKKNFKTLLTR